MTTKRAMDIVLDIFQKQPAQPLSEAYAAKRAEVVALRAELMHALRTNRAWQRVDELFTGKEEFCFMGVNCFFAYTVRSLLKNDTAAFDAATFECPSTHSVLHLSVLEQYLRRTRTAPPEELSPAELNALLQATFPPPTAYDPSSGIATVHHHHHEVEESGLLRFWTGMCQTHNVSLSASSVLAQLLAIVSANNPDLMFVNRTDEYDEFKHRRAEFFDSLGKIDSDALNAFCANQRKKMRTGAGAAEAAEAAGAELKL